VSYDEARPQIEQEVKAEAAANQAYAMTQKYEDAHDKGASVADAAKAAGVMATQVGPVDANGNDAAGKPGGLTPKMVKDGFALTQGADTDVQQEGKGEYYVLHADKVIPPQAPTLDKVRDRLTQFFQQQEMAKRLSARLQDLVGQVKKGQTMDAVAATVGAKVTMVSLTRAQAQQDQKIPPEQVEQLFQGKPGDVIASGAAVVKVVSIEPPQAAMASVTIAQAQQQLARSVFEEVSEEARAYARAKLKAKVNLALARQAIGVSEPAGQAAPPAGAPAPASRAK
jgi:peptidyl-prolyl cis-trans isomerase D